MKCKKGFKSHFSKKKNSNEVKGFHCILLASSKNDPLKINFETYERFPLEDYHCILGTRK